MQETVVFDTNLKEKSNFVQEMVILSTKLLFVCGVRTCKALRVTTGTSRRLPCQLGRGR